MEAIIESASHAARYTALSTSKFERLMCGLILGIRFTCEVEFLGGVLEEGTAMIVYGDIAQPPALLPDS